MKIGALQKLSLIDYPGKIACVVFTQGCNFRCGFCHNPQLVLPEKFSKTIDENIILRYLSQKAGKIQGVVITGGEPVIQNDLPDFLAQLKRLKLPVKLDTNGSSPEMLLHLLHEKLVDYIAMDIKTVFSKYSKLCGIPADTNRLSESIKIIKESGIDHQFRITLIKNVHDLYMVKALENQFSIKLSRQYFRCTPLLISDEFSDENVFNEDELAVLL